MGQTVSPPFNPDYKASLFGVNAASIEHTGNDIKPNGKRFWHVNTWDGDAPAWSYAVDNAVIQTSPIQGTILGKVTDPDIVLSADLQWVRIVYVLDGTIINTELWQYNGSGYSYISTQTLTTEGINPNIDVNNRSLVAVTYQDISSPFVYSYVEEINNTLFGPVFINAEGQRPDVAISNEKGGLGGVVVSFTYIQPGNNVLVLDQHRYTNILGGSSTPISFSVHPPDVWSTNNGTFGYPRIAHNWYNETFTGCSTTVNDWHLTCAVAVDFKATNNDEYIYTLTRVTNGCNTQGTYLQLGITNLLNNAFAAFQQNRKPVVTYCGDVIVVAWEYLNPGVPPFQLPSTLNRDIIVWRLNWNGTHWGINNYSRANDIITGEQVIPSVSGRYSSSGASSADCYYLFVDENLDRVLFKGSFYHNNNLKSLQTGNTSYTKDQSFPKENRLQLYPNPAHDRMVIQGLSTNATLEVFDKLGRKLIQQRAEGNQNELIFPENMISGSYILKIQDEMHGIKHLSFIKE